jgi:ATP-GRASP peptide maturase of grasp-with-spasm system
VQSPILIFSVNFDPTTCLVIQWLNKFQVPWIRLNCNADATSPYNVQIGMEGTVVTLTDGQQVSVDDIKTVWFRRYENNSGISFNKYFSYENAVVLDTNLRTEKAELTNFLYLRLKEKRWLNHPRTSNVNKLHQLSIAQRIGLHIPETIVSFDRQVLVDFVKRNKQAILKPIQNMMPFHTEGELYLTFAELINAEDLESIATDRLFPCQLQSYIEKEFEIRAFYLGGKFYSMAIFSQKDEQTKVDFRRYNYEKMNRRVPFKLPVELEEQLKAFMEAVDLNSGSLDLVFSKDKKYYFLEVNPVGQFGMVSFPCNYYLERIVAEELCKV